MLLVVGPGTEYEMRSPHLLPAAVEPERMRAAAEAMLAESYALRAEERDALRRRSVAAFMLLTVGELNRAAELLEKCASRFRALDDMRNWFSSSLRLVQVLQAQGCAESAVALADGIVAQIEKCEALREFEHFGLHHLGKALLQASDAVRATDVLTKALALRQGTEQASLIDSTNEALALARNAVTMPARRD